MMSELTVTVHVSPFRMFIVRWAIRFWKLGCALTFHRPSVREMERVSNRLTSFLAGGVTIGRKRHRLRIVREPKG